MAARGRALASGARSVWASSTILRLPVAKYRLRMPASIMALPNRVYTTYFMAEYSFLPLPQMEIRKYMGMTSISQKMKNSNRSREQNTPRMLVSSRRSQAKYCRTLKSTFQEMRTTRKPIRVVKTTRGRLRPSTPKW